MYPPVHDGDLNWAYLDVATQGSGDLVVPKALRTDVAAPSAGDPWVERSQIILLGWHYSVTADAASEGFRLVAIEGDGTVNPIMAAKAASGTSITGSAQCFIPLSAAGSATPLAAAAKLSVVIVGTPVVADLTVWYMHSSGGSARIYGASPPFSYS